MNEFQDNFQTTNQLISDTGRESSKTENHTSIDLFYKRKGSTQSNYSNKLQITPSCYKRGIINKSFEQLADIAEDEYLEENSGITAFTSSDNLNQLQDIEEEEHGVQSKDSETSTMGENRAKQPSTLENLQQTIAWNISFCNDDPYETGRKLEQGLNLLSW